VHDDQRTSVLHDYTVLRTYQVVDLKGKVHAEEIGRMEFFSPDKKTFAVTSESGSGLVRHMVLNPLIDSEIEAAAVKAPFPPLVPKVPKEMSNWVLRLATNL
jgi:hypothetical protein